MVPKSEKVNFCPKNHFFQFLAFFHQFFQQKKKKKKGSCVVWWDAFALQTALYMICPPFHLKLMYLENCNSHTDKSIHFWKA